MERTSEAEATGQKIGVAAVLLGLVFSCQMVFEASSVFGKMFFGAVAVYLAYLVAIGMVDNLRYAEEEATRAQERIRRQLGEFVCEVGLGHVRRETHERLDEQFYGGITNDKFLTYWRFWDSRHFEPEDVEHA